MHVIAVKPKVVWCLALLAVLVMPGAAYACPETSLTEIWLMLVVVPVTAGSLGKALVIRLLLRKGPAPGFLKHVIVTGADLAIISLLVLLAPWAAGIGGRPVLLAGFFTYLIMALPPHLAILRGVDRRLVKALLLEVMFLVLAVVTTIALATLTGN